MASSESALVVLVPEAESLVQPFRERYDPSAAMGMPAHVTLLYPFLAPDHIGAATLAELETCFRRFSPFRFTLADIARFPGVLYLSPEPDTAFGELTMAIWKCSPDCPPYGGRHTEIVPHLSVAALSDEQRIEAVAEEFLRASAGKPPIEANAHEVALMENRCERWTLRTTFRLASRDSAGMLRSTAPERTLLSGSACSWLSPAAAFDVTYRCSAASSGERRTMKVKFVDSALRSLKPHRVKYDVHDPEGAPLALRVSPDGRKTWMACYASPTGAMQFRAIGKYPMMSIAAAREKARSVVGGDPEAAK